METSTAVEERPLLYSSTSNPPVCGIPEALGNVFFAKSILDNVCVCSAFVGKKIRNHKGKKKIDRTKIFRTDLFIFSE
jgi:hypothetical protein